MTEGIELAAYCGLYCGDCIRYRSRASDLARELLSELRNMEFCKYAKIKTSRAASPMRTRFDILTSLVW